MLEVLEVQYLCLGNAINFGSFFFFFFNEFFIHADEFSEFGSFQSLLFLMCSSFMQLERW
jgi:hypothetical protein